MAMDTFVEKGFGGLGVGDALGDEGPLFGGRLHPLLEDIDSGGAQHGPQSMGKDALLKSIVEEIGFQKHRMIPLKRHYGITTFAHQGFRHVRQGTFSNHG